MPRIDQNRIDVPCVQFNEGSQMDHMGVCDGGHDKIFTCLTCPEYHPDPVFKQKEKLKAIFQYGNSEPSEDEQEAFFNWLHDTLGI